MKVHYAIDNGRFLSKRNRFNRQPHIPYDIVVEINCRDDLYIIDNVEYGFKEKLLLLLIL